MSTLHSDALDLEIGTGPNPATVATMSGGAAAEGCGDTEPVAIDLRKACLVNVAIVSFRDSSLDSSRHYCLFVARIKQHDLVFFFLAPLAANAGSLLRGGDHHLRVHRVLAAGRRRIFTFWGSFCVHRGGISPVRRIPRHGTSAEEGYRWHVC